MTLFLNICCIGYQDAVPRPINTGHAWVGMGCFGFPRSPALIVRKFPLNRPHIYLGHGMQVFSKKGKQFRALFPDLPDSETLLSDYSCAMQREILVHGRLWVPSRSCWLFA